MVKTNHINRRRKFYEKITDSFIGAYAHHGRGGLQQGRWGKNPDENPDTPTGITSIDDFVTKVGELDGLTLTKETAFYEMVGAKNGYKLTDKDTGEVMEIYAFDKASDAYKKAETDQKLTIESMSYSFDVKTSNGYAILLPENFPQKDAVLGLFNTLQ